MSTVDPPVCVALDVPDLPAAQRVLDELLGIIPLFKVGLELFCAEGPRTVEAVKEAGAPVFLDLKINDIPRTAAAAVREASKMGVALITVMGFGGRDMIRAAVESAAEHGGPEVLVVSSLTSLDDERLHEIGVGRGVKEQAMGIGRLAAEEGASGLVLSPRELDVVRSALPHLLLATPGVRPSGSSPDDHRRVLTPADAILAGADLVVIGRPVLDAADRRGAARAIVQEVLEAEAQRESLGSDDPPGVRGTEDVDIEEDDRA